MIVPVNEAYVVVTGDPSCPHYDTQIVAYRSPTCEAQVWSCPICHRIVRQDIPVGAGDWTEPEVVVPHGLSGRPIPGTDRRGWAMPDATPLTRRKSLISWRPS